MAFQQDDDRPQPKPVHEIGQDLARLSVEELRARIAALEAEAARLRSAIEQKTSDRERAEGFFRTGV